MARLKTLSQEEFTRLYNFFSYPELCYFLKITFNPIEKRAKKYGLPSKVRGRRSQVSDGVKSIPEDIQRIIDKVLRDDAEQIARDADNKARRMRCSGKR